MTSELWLLFSCLFGLLIVLAAYYLLYQLPEAAEGFASRRSERSWILGFLVPLIGTTHGVYSLISQSFMLGDGYVLEGPTAVSFSLALLSAAAALHFHFFWGAAKRWVFLSEIGKGVSMLLVVVFMCSGFYFFFTT